MSWIFGAAGGAFDHTQLSSYIHRKSKSSLQHYTNNIFLTAGGNGRTLHSKLNKNDGWIVCGLGLNVSKTSSKILTTSDWDKLFQTGSFTSDEVDGHFIALRWQNGELKFFTDSMGLRNIYFSHSSKGIIFSTRLDLLAGLNDLQIDYKVFGSRWLLFNQLSDDSCLIDIIKLSKGESSTITNGKLRINPSHKNKLFKQEQTEAENNFNKTLNSILNCRQTNHKLILALSGGLDSRLLLSYLLKYRKDNFETITFGNPNQPDAIIASRMAKTLGFNHRVVHSALPEKDVLISEIENAASFWQAVNPVSAFLNLRYYNEVSDNSIIIDGGFGEIWRLEFLKKFQLLGKRLVKNEMIDKIFQIFKFHRADIFNADTLQLMEEGAIEQIRERINSLPGITDTGFSNRVDLFSINTRLPNFYAPEQIRIDSFAASFMPFVQPALIKYLFSIQTGERKNGKFFKSLIKQNFSQLSKFPLVKGNSIHPFGLSSVQSRLWNKFLSQRRYASATNNDKIFLFDQLKDFMMDIINSAEVKEYPHYNYQRILENSNRYYKGETQFLNFVDWFLSFELFRRSLSSN